MHIYTYSYTYIYIFIPQTVFTLKGSWRSKNRYPMEVFQWSPLKFRAPLSQMVQVTFISSRRNRGSVFQLFECMKRNHYFFFTFFHFFECMQRNHYFFFIFSSVCSGITTFAVCGCLWLSVAVYACLCLSVAVPASSASSLWLSVAVFGCLWLSVTGCGCL